MSAQGTRLSPFSIFVQFSAHLGNPVSAAERTHSSFYEPLFFAKGGNLPFGLDQAKTYAFERNQEI